MYTITLTLHEAIHMASLLQRLAEEDRMVAKDMKTEACREYFLEEAEMFQSIYQRIDHTVGIGGV